MATQTPTTGITIKASSLGDYLFRCAHEFFKASMTLKKEGNEEGSILQMVAAGAILQPLKEYLAEYPPERDNEKILVQNAFSYYDTAHNHLVENLVPRDKK